MVKFSERIGLEQPQTILQIESMTDELRNSLWNIIYTLYERGSSSYWRRVAKFIAQHFRKTPVDEVPFEDHRCRKWLKSYFYGLEWNKVYEFVEFIVDNHDYMMRENTGRGGIYIYHPVKQPNLIRMFNHVLKKELSGYHFISGILTPISDEVEVESIESAIRDADNLGFIGVKEHLKTALDLLGKKPDPDYRNAIKEAVSSIESLSKIITGNNAQGLTGALNELTKETDIHQALRSGFIKLYGWTSNDDGIRHAILNQPNVGFTEAKYMIVSCSAFVNYLIGKADQAGLLTAKQK